MASKQQTVINRPMARTDNLLVETIGNETVIYDHDTDFAHALKPLAAAVFMYADGRRTLAEIAELTSYRLDAPVTATQVDEAVTELDRLALLDRPEIPLAARGLSRRDALKAFGAVGAGTLLISSVAAPTAFAATGNWGQGYTCGAETDNTTSTSNATDNAGVNPVIGTSPPATWPASQSYGWASPGVDQDAFSLIGQSCGVGTDMCMAYSTPDNWWVTPTVPMYPSSSTFTVTTTALAKAGATIADWTPPGWTCTLSSGTYTCNGSLCPTGWTTGTKSGNTFCTGLSTSGLCSGGTCDTFTPSSSTCAPTGDGWDGSPVQLKTNGSSGAKQTGEPTGAYIGNPGSTTQGYTNSPPVPPNGATYQCVPCTGGSAGGYYTCCQVVCVPVGTNWPYEESGGVDPNGADDPNGYGVPFTNVSDMIAAGFTHSHNATGYTNLYCTEAQTS